MAKYALLLLSISLISNCMEISNSSGISHNLKQADDLLTKIKNKEESLSNTDNDALQIKEAFKNLITLREQLNIHLQPLTISAYDQQFYDIKNHSHQINLLLKPLHPEDHKEIRNQLQSYTHEHNQSLEQVLTILDEARQTKRLAKRGLMIKEFSSSLPKLSTNYECIKNESNNLFYNIRETYSPFIKKLKTFANQLTDNQENLSVANSLVPVSETTEAESSENNTTDTNSSTIAESIYKIQTVSNNTTKLQSIQAFLSIFSQINHFKITKTILGKIEDKFIEEIENVLTQKDEQSILMYLDQAKKLDRVIQKTKVFDQHTSNKTTQYTPELQNARDVAIKAINELCINLYKEQLENNLKEINRLKEIQEFTEENYNNALFLFTARRCGAKITTLNTHNGWLNRDIEALLKEQAIEMM